MPKTKVEVYDKDQLIYPYIESDHVTFSNGMKVSEMLDQSISMPTVTHEDLSFKVGVGDQDVSSAIVDSSVSEMTIKGKTYQNILPEPSTHVLTNNKEMFKVNEGLDSNVEIVDGISKSAILKGQTLVNIRGKAVDTQANLIDYEVYGLQNNTTYTIVVESTDTNVISVVGFLKDTGHWNCETAPRTQNCKVVLTTTSAELMGRVRVRKDNKQDTSQAIQIRVMVLEGDYSKVDLPYFEGMASCETPVLTTVGKNLFDGVNQGYYLNIETRLAGITSNDSGAVIDVSSINKATVSSTTIQSRFRIACANTLPKQGEGTVRVYNGINLDGNSSTKVTIDCSNYKYLIVNATDLSIIQVEQGSTATPYEPYKTNILSTPEEVVLRSLPNGVCDTLNLNTGEYVKRIGEVVLDGSENWGVIGANKFYTNIVSASVKRNSQINVLLTDKLRSDSWVNVFANTSNIYDVFGVHDNGNIETRKQDITTVEEWKTLLTSNPITVQYQLETPIIKTVDLSSSGNWDKVILNGNETWSVHSNWSGGEFLAVQTQVANKLGGGLAFTDSTQFKGMSWKDSSVDGQPSKECVRYDSSGAVLYVFIKKSRLTGETVNDFKKWLQENPIAVWYQTATHQNSTKVKQPIFFKDGHIQLSSGADNSLIPTLDYQAKTSNSYVIDLMKANTRYTMKAKSASGTFTIDGTSYGAGTNSTFTTPPSITNKLLVMSNKANEEVMILEGDVTDKTIPYFKGIKSAFEGEDKIEVLSTGKNLFDNSRVNNYLAEYLDNGYVKATGGKQGDIFAEQKAKPFIKPNTKYTITVDVIENTMTGLFEVQYSGDRRASLKTSFYIDAGFVGRISRTCDSKEVIENELVLVPKVITQNTSGHVIFRIIVEETLTPTSYESHRLNSTKIPLLSPLRSLPNGVYDELIIDRMKNKATLIQRVGYSVINSEFAKNGANWANNNDTDPCWGFHCGNYVQGTFKLNEHNSINDKLPIKGMATTGDPLMGYYQSNPHIAVRRLEASNLTMALNWLDRNPINFYYQLETPVVTEVDLEGFPYIYKDGHIFLNSEIVPTTEITYSINQCQQISASNEDIIRHEKELTYLQKLIAQYVQVDYESALLSLKV